MYSYHPPEINFRSHCKISLLTEQIFIICYIYSGNNLFLNINSNSMEPRIKVSKHMPDVFLHSRTVVAKDKDKKHVEKIPQAEKPVQQKIALSSQGQNEKKAERGGKKKSRNPLINVWQYLKLSKQMDERMKEVRQELDLDRFSQFNLENMAEGVSAKEQVKQHRIKYQDCLTLSLMKKTQSSCLKKILHVPTLTVYYLRESLIDFSIDKADLQEWIRKCNSQSTSSPLRPQKIVELYWNIPETYYSIIYQYQDGVLFEAILQNISICPIQFLQNLTLTHLKADLQIFNSILIIKRNPQSEIRYLSVYEEVDDLVPQYRTFRELLKINHSEVNQDVKKLQKIMVARLGFLLLVTFFSDAIVDEDISNILFQSKDCCLFHKQMSNPASLMKVYFQNNITSGSEKEILADFFCKMLKFKTEERANFVELSKHRFFKTKFGGQICRMQEIISVLESAGVSNSSKNPSRQLANHKLNKIINSMTLILQGASERQKKQIDLSPTNPTIRFILHELGFSNNESELKNNINDVISKFKRVYQL